MSKYALPRTTGVGLRPTRGSLRSPGTLPSACAGITPYPPKTPNPWAS
ncbi:hypothetical protein [Bacteroides caecimuris]|nr:hypothetical protein [Bacteroides caecimuris]